MKEKEKVELFKQKYGRGWLRQWNSYQKALNSRGKSYSNYKDKPKLLWTDWDYYRDRVGKITEQVKHQIDNIDKRGFRSYHIDHKISIKYGYDNGILPEYIAHITNLHMLYWKDNVRKKDSILVDTLNEWIVGTGNSRCIPY